MWVTSAIYRAPSTSSCRVSSTLKSGPAFGNIVAPWNGGPGRCRKELAAPATWAACSSRRRTSATSGSTCALPRVQDAVGRHELTVDFQVFNVFNWLNRSYSTWGAGGGDPAPRIENSQIANDQRSFQAGLEVQVLSSDELGEGDFGNVSLPFCWGGLGETRTAPCRARVQSPVVVIDDFSGSCDAIVAARGCTCPLSADRSRQLLSGRAPSDRSRADADRRTTMFADLCSNAPRSSLRERSTSTGSICSEASFSMVTANPIELACGPARAALRFNRSEVFCAAPLSARSADGTGTAFYRQRSTGIERVTEANIAQLRHDRRAEAAMLPTGLRLHPRVEPVL